MLIVMKFGGSSLAGPEAVRRSAAIIAEARQRGDAVAAVLSAQGDATDELLDMAALYSAAPPPRELDMLLSTGEQTSAALMAMTLEDMGIGAVSLTGYQAGVETDAAFGMARIRRLDLRRVERELELGRVPLITGFQGVSPSGDVTTLGRGGSDTSAVAVAAGLEADRCLIYTDVEGVYTADPRLVPRAVKLSRIDISEMYRLASMGSQVLHPRSVAMAARYRVPLEVRSSLVRAPGTEVLPLPLPEDRGRLTALSRSGPMTTLVGTRLHRLPDLADRAFAALDREGIRPASSLFREEYLTLQVGEERSLDALLILHKEFIET